MRDGVDLQPFRVNSDVLDSDAIDTIIMASVLREFELKKAAEALADGAAVTEVLAEGSLASPAVEILSRARGRGQRGRGRPRGGRGRGTVRGGRDDGRPVTSRITELQAS
jgi:hypothetical protein